MPTRKCEKYEKQINQLTAKKQINRMPNKKHQIRNTDMVLTWALGLLMNSWMANMKYTRCQTGSTQNTKYRYSSDLGGGIINVGWPRGRPPLPLGASAADSDAEHFYEIIPTPALPS